MFGKTHSWALLFIVLLLSILYSFTQVSSVTISSFEWGFAAGAAFAQALKLIGAFGFIAYGIHTIKRRGSPALY